MKFKRTIIKIVIGLLFFGIAGLVIGASIRNIKNNKMVVDEPIFIDDQTFGYGEMWYPDGDYLVPVVDSWGIRVSVASISGNLWVDGYASISDGITIGGSNVPTAPLDFSDFANTMTLDANTSLASATYTFDWGETHLLGIATVSQITLGRQYITKEYGDTNYLGGVGFDFFFTDTRAGFGVDNYYGMVDVDTGQSETSIATTSFGAGDDQFLAGFVTSASEPVFVELLGGNYQAHFHAQRVSGLKSVNIYWTLSKIDTSANETVLITSELSNGVDDKIAFDIHGTLASDTTIASTDRLLLKLFANIGAVGGDVAITIFQEGTLDSRVGVHTSTDVFSDLFIRRDGTVAMTGDWAMGTYDITGGDYLGFNSASFSEGMFVDGTASISVLNLDDALGVVYGGTGLKAIGASELLYGSSANTIAAIASGADDYVLLMSEGVPTWGANVGTTYTIAGDPLLLSGTQFDIQYASSAGGGYLTNTDWDTFNAKADTDFIAHELLGSWHEDTLEASVSEGSLMLGNATPAWSELGIGASSSFLMSDGTTAVWNDLQSSFINHDATTNFLATEHVDWAGGSAGTIHVDNYIEGIDGCSDCLNATEIEDIYLLDDGDTGTGAFIFSAASLEIPNAAGPTVDANGEVAIDTTDGQFIYFSGVKEVLMATESFGFTLSADQMASSSWHIEKQFLEPVTIVRISCRAKNGTSWQMELLECDANGANCSDVDAVITCGTTRAYDDGTLTNATIDALDTVVASYSQGDITGAVETGYVDVWYKWTAQ